MYEFIYNGIYINEHLPCPFCMIGGIGGIPLVTPGIVLVSKKIFHVTDFSKIAL